MSIIAVDLAAKFSAACRMDWNGQITAQVDSWGGTETLFIDRITAPWALEATTATPDALIVEDLPQRVPFMTVTKAVCRLQGRIIERMAGYGRVGAIVFVPPAEWRRHYEGLERGTGPAAVVPVAARLGYTPPDLTARITGKGDRARARKVATDYCAAFLIGRWALSTFDTHGTFDVATTSRHVETTGKV